MLLALWTDSECNLDLIRFLVWDKFDDHISFLFFMVFLEDGFIMVYEMEWLIKEVAFVDNEI